MMRCPNLRFVELCLRVIADYGTLDVLKSKKLKL